MSFGLKAFKRTQTLEHKSQNRQHIANVILGHDLSAVLKLVSLKDSHAPENLRLITPRFLTKNSLIESYNATLSSLRDPEATLKVLEKFPHAQSSRVDKESLFHKEGHWHKFSGRAKPMNLAPGESFFLSPRQDLAISSLFTPSDWEQLDEILKAYQSVRVLERIEKQVPTELVDRAQWWMLFHDLGEVTCEDLWVTLPARTMLKASEHGSTLPAEAAAWYTGVKHQAAIGVFWEFKEEIYPEAATLFVPQSMTHEWGHFILDVHPYDEAKRSFPVQALILLPEEEATTELMADKIKLLKRVMERVFTGFEKKLVKESILASEDFFEEVTATGMAESVLVGVPHLHLMGQSAATTSNDKFLTRALLTI